MISFFRRVILLLSLEKVQTVAQFLLDISADALANQISQFVGILKEKRYLKKESHSIN